MAGKSVVFVDNSAPSVDDNWLNLRQNEVRGLVESSGQTLSDVINDQEAKAVANYAAQAGVFGTDSGVADAYIITQVSPFKAPTALKDGMTIRFRAANVNTGACTVNAFGLTAIAIKKPDGLTNLDAGDIPTTQDTILRYNSSVWVLSSGAASTTAKGIVELLTGPELATGTDTTRAATAASILSLFSASTLAAESTYKFPINISGSFGETIVKIGLSPGTINGVASSTITFGSAFPSGCRWAMGIMKSNNVLGATDSALLVDTFNSTSITFDRGQNGGGASHALRFYWIAIGE